MKVYLINVETNEVINTYDKVLHWGYNYVEYDNNGRAKIYCSENEYFTDKEPEVIEEV